MPGTELPARRISVAAALLLATGCGGTSAGTGAGGSDASGGWQTVVTGPSLDGGQEGGGVDSTLSGTSPFDAGLDAADAAIWPRVDSSCTPPPFDASAESSVPSGDGGLSTVTTLPDGGYVDWMTADDTNVYWTDDSLDAVWTAPLAGGPPQVVANMGTPEPGGIALDESYVFWTDSRGQRILRCPKGVRDCTPFVVLAPFEVRGLALDADNVYTVTSSQGVLACAKTGCRNAPTVIASGLGTAYDLTISGDTLFWLDYPPPTGFGVQIYAHVVKCPVTGCGDSPTVLATDDSPSGLATDGRYVYWVSQPQADQPAAIKRCAVCGCGGNPEVLLPATAGALTYSVSTDGLHLFFDSTFVDAGTNVGVEQIVWCSVDGCRGAPTPVVTGLDRWTSWSVGGVGAGTILLATQTQILSLHP